MMKYCWPVLIIMVVVLFAQCAKRYKVTYDIPDNYPEARRQQIIEIFYKGKELFKANCSECHGVFTKGREKVPNFTNEQLDNYSSRFIRGDLKNHSVAMQMSPEQLNQVMLFLKFKKTDKKDTVSIRKPK